MINWKELSAADKVAEIVNVYVKGNSASDIAKALTEGLDYQVTRNAVIGFYHRVASRASRNARMNPLNGYPLQAQGFNEEEQRRRRVERQKLATERRRERNKAEAARKLAAGETKPPKPKPNKAEAIARAETAPITTQDEGYGVPMPQVGDEGCMWPTSSQGNVILFCNHHIAAKRQRYCEHHGGKATLRVSITHDLKLRDMR